MAALLMGGAGVVTGWSCGGGSNAPDAPDGSTDAPANTDGAGGGGGAGTGGASGDGAGTDTGGVPPAGCVMGGPACNDCVDNDGDGLTDYYDPECTGPLDNDEGTFSTGIPGDNVDACKQDCFFDGDSGMGNDHCEWNLKCDPKNPGKDLKCPYDKNYKNCPDMQDKRCKDFCLPKTPNGCDCFGCCDINGHSVLLVPTCTFDKLDDPKACPPCTQNSDCTNTCERCEICLGKDKIPDDCPRPDGGVPPGDGGVYDGGTDAPPPPPPPSCPEAYQPCGSGGIEPGSCPMGSVCVTGCCVPWVP